MKHTFFTIILAVGLGITGLQGGEKTAVEASLEAGDESRAQRAAESAALQQAALLARIAANQEKQIAIQKEAAEQQDYRAREIILRLDNAKWEPALK